MSPSESLATRATEVTAQVITRIRNRPVVHLAFTGSNLDRLVGAAKAMLAMFGYGGLSGIAEDKIRSRLNEAGARRAIEELHRLTAPPYK